MSDKAVTANLKKQSGTIHQVKWSPNEKLTCSEPATGVIESTTKKQTKHDSKKDE